MALCEIDGGNGQHQAAGTCEEMSIKGQFGGRNIRLVQTAQTEAPQLQVPRNRW